MILHYLHWAPLKNFNFTIKMQTGVEEAIFSLSSSLAVQPEENEKFLLLVEQVQTLINEDFSSLVYLLYRIDVRESLIKETLALHPTENTAILIARLIIQRQIEKIETRKKYRSPGHDIPPEDKW